MKLFKHELKKNILILGDSACGKRSFLYCYKEEKSCTNMNFNIEKEMVYRKKLADGTNNYVTLNFILDTGSDRLIPSMPSQKNSFDLILVLADLSLDHCHQRIDHYTRLANLQYSDVPTLTIGTKSDLQNRDIDDNDLLITSAKNYDGFDNFDHIFMSRIQLEPVRCSCNIL